jgi:hypothetical protein
MRICAITALLLLPAALHADAPVASYIFPAGGQRGTKVDVRVGGLFLYERCGFEMLGDGVKASAQLRRVPTLWFEGPLLPLPASQRQEDYPRDMAGEIVVAPDAVPGVRRWRVWTAQGATSSLKFLVGELPEIIEHEIDGDPLPVAIATPLTVNGRIFPRGDIDIWSFRARNGENFTCEVQAARLGSPLEARLEIRDGAGRRLAENDTTAADPLLHFKAPDDGVYQVHIHDTRGDGGQAFVYRLTVSSGPYVERVFPLGGKRGSKLSLELAGQNLPAQTATVALAAGQATEHLWRLDGKASAIALAVDDLPEHVEPVREPIALPAVCNGRVARAGEVDRWQFKAAKGATYDFELRAAEFGSPLDGVLAIEDVAGKQLASVDTPAAARATLRFAAPADGVYTALVRDRFRSRGGPAFAYRLRAAAPVSDFRLTLAADAVSLPRGGQAKLKLNAERLGGMKEPIALAIDNLPEGVTFTPATIAANQAAVDLTFKADAKARVQQARLTIKGSAKLGADATTRVAHLAAARGEEPAAQFLVAVALPTPFKIKGEYDMGFASRGSVHKRRYVIERDGYDGPIEVSLADRQARHLQGVTGPTIVVPAGAQEFTYEVTLPSWMETGRTSRTCVMGVATVREADGSEHRVSFSSVNQNEQLVAVVGPGKLALTLERSALTAQPGATIALPVQVRRDPALQGDVKVELVLPTHVSGIMAEALVIPAGQERGMLTLRCAERLQGPFNMPLTVRASLSGPAVAFAEAKLEVDRD